MSTLHSAATKQNVHMYQYLSHLELYHKISQLPTYLLQLAHLSHDILCTTQDVISNCMYRTLRAGAMLRDGKGGYLLSEMAEWAKMLEMQQLVKLI